MERAIDLLAFIDISRRNVERAMRAGNYYSAAFLAEEMSKEAMSLSKECNKAGRTRALQEKRSKAFTTQL